MLHVMALSYISVNVQKVKLQKGEMMELSDGVQRKLDELASWYGERKGSIVAFSGGIDSTLALFLARKYQGRDYAIGVISQSESLKARDFDFARDFCRDFDIKLEVIRTRELEDERYAKNPANRCFYCKQHLFVDIGVIAQSYPGFAVLSGANHDDLGDFRPGMEAARKYEVLSPFVDCKVGKAEIRALARFFGLPNWDKPASPCLSSRIPYNQVVTAEKLQQIEAAEEILLAAGFSNARVRHYGDTARVEVPADELPALLDQKEKVTASIQDLGFHVCEIDEEGLVSGKLNRVLGRK